MHSHQCGHSHKTFASVGGEAPPQVTHPDSPLVKKCLCCKGNKRTKGVREEHEIKPFINDHVQQAYPKTEWNCAWQESAGYAAKKARIVAEASPLVAATTGRPGWGGATHRSHSATQAAHRPDG